MHLNSLNLETLTSKAISVLKISTCSLKPLTLDSVLNFLT
uniref:Uncharacterized protein n=1 Tax=Lepeophtheirus salmonis TaxID=72036 RepID=A0A0K2T6I0_LEPSM